MATINLGVLSFGSKIDLSGFRAGIQKVQSDMSGLAQKVPVIGPAMQASASIGSRAFNAVKRAVDAVKSAISSLIGSIFSYKTAIAVAVAGMAVFIQRSGGVKAAFSSLKVAIPELVTKLGGLSGILSKIASGAPLVVGAVGGIRSVLNLFKGSATEAARSATVLGGSMSIVKGAVSGLVSGFAPLLALLGPLALIGFVRQSITAFTESEAAAKRLESSLKGLTGATDEQVAALNEQATALQRTTTFEDDAITSAQGTLAAMGATTDQILQLTPAILDATTALNKMGAEGGDLTGVAFAVSKAVAGNETALQRLGIQFDATTKKQFEHANQAERVALITERLSKFQGAAAAQAQTFGGRITQLKNVFGDVQEAVGEFVLKLFDMGGTGNTVIDMLSRLRTNIVEATKTEEFGQLVTVVKQVWSAFGDVFDAGYDVIRALFGLGKQTSNTNAVLLGMRKVAEVVIVAMKSIALAISLVQQFVQLLAAGWKSGMALITGVVANWTLSLVNHFERVISAGQAVAQFFGRDLPAPIQRLRSLVAGFGSDVARGMVERIDDAQTSVMNLGSTMNQTEGRFVALIGAVRQLTGDADVVSTRVEDFADGLERTGRAAGQTSEDLDEAAGSTDAVADAAEKAKREFALFETILNAARSATDAFRSGVESARTALSNTAAGIRNDIAQLEARNRVIRAKTELDRIDAEQAARNLAVEQEKAANIERQKAALAELVRQEESAQATLRKLEEQGINRPALSPVGPDGPQIPSAVDPRQQEEFRKAQEEFQRLQAERQRVAAETAQVIVAEETRAAAELRNIAAETDKDRREELQRIQAESDEARQRRIEKERENAERELAGQVKLIEQKQENDLRALDLEARRRIAAGEDKLRVEADVQRRRITIVETAERAIQALNDSTGRSHADLVQQELDLEYKAAEERVALSEATNAIIAKQNEDRIAKIKATIDTELFEIEDGQIRMRDIVAGTQKKILESIVKTANASFEAWLTGQNQMVASSQSAAGSIQGIFGNLGSSLGGIFSGISSAFGGLFGRGGSPGIAGGIFGGGGGGGLGGIFGSIAGFLGNPIVGIGAALLGSLFGKKKSGPASTGTIADSIASSARGVFEENQKRAATTAQSIARDTGATNLIQQISFPVTIRVETQESDRIAEGIKRAVKDEVVPTLKKEIADKERDALLRNIGTPRRLSYA